MAKEVLQVTYPQLIDNILFILEEQNVLKPGDHYTPAKLAQVTNYMKHAILASDPGTLMWFIDGQTVQPMRMSLSDIAQGPDGLPMVDVTKHYQQYMGSHEPFALFGWYTNAHK